MCTPSAAVGGRPGVARRSCRFVPALPGGGRPVPHHAPAAGDHAKRSDLGTARVPVARNGIAGAGSRAEVTGSRGGGRHGRIGGGGRCDCHMAAVGKRLSCRPNRGDIPLRKPALILGPSRRAVALGFGSHTKGCSSNWQSAGLQNRRLWVRVPPPLLVKGTDEPRTSPPTGSRRAA